MQNKPAQKKAKKLILNSYTYLFFFLENESVGLDYKTQLRKLSESQLKKLYEMKKVELDMFGYTFDPKTLEMGLRPE